MSTQIDNLSLSFNEILYNIGDLFDDLYTDKTANLVLPNNNNKAAENLNKAIKTFDKNLDDILIQLNDISLFDKKLKQRAIEREQQKNTIPAKQEPTPANETKQPEIESRTAQNTSNDNTENFGNHENLLDDISNFLSTVPDSADVNLNGDFNDNIQDLLMDANPYDDPNNTETLDFQNNSNNDNQNNAQNNMNDNSNLEFDNNIFNEIDSMLNI
ncbi:hypothetical protein WICANDRAFT_65426 [Wickerhamomyces anomalus NRRL Y-366-8]|uniref:Uncharacterized protein n=1 Tax=Wickerhamomyces anomalus (strain ATCC 58044 / CBS 1984 / NCYC 433 / NRRL Y-366-8) TaxID=683960 RepID=A0A1E3NVK8_WICAA|nr:uncharacterized protein WICANDRAFT_65426 [Wickerhamomyces anomalus NRRL Y-366-8]ODQ57166.1 hypothetical protein WICANDRAFT_65426 [Wickerhamomyces anomalus NRRL Y-366-8]